MKFYMPTRVYSGINAVKAHADEMRIGAHALIVTGKSSSRKNGSLDDVVSVLEKNGTAYTVFDDVEENPSVETVMAARDRGISCGADHVIGIGGGSPLDCAKAAALMINNPDRDWQFMYEDTRAQALPMIAVPTTCGTGSEVTGVSVITRHDLGTKGSIKHRIFPVLALVDGRYLLEAPSRIIKNTAVDALAHLIESGVNAQADTFSDMNVFAGLAEWRKCRPYIEGREALTEDAALMLMNASSLAGMSIAQTGTTLPHSLSYLLTYEAHIPHGAAVGVFQANYIACAEKDRRQAMLSAAGFDSPDDLRRVTDALAPVKADRALLELSAEAVLANPAKLALCPFAVDRQVMYGIIDI